MPGNYTTANHEDQIMAYWHRYYRPDLLGWKVTRIESPSEVPQQDVIWLDTEPTGLDPTKMFYIEYDPRLVPELKFTTDLPGVAGGDAGATYIPTNGSQDFAVAVSGGIPPIAYQWKKVSGGNTTDLTNGSGYSGVTSPTMTISNYNPGNHNADYFVTATDSTGKVITSQRVRARAAVAFSTNLATTATWTAGASASLTVAVNTNTGFAPYSYQWYKNGQALAGKTAATLTIASPTAADAGEYYCVATSSNTNPPKTVESIHCVVTVNAALAFSTDLPATKSVATGAALTLGPVAVTGGKTPYTYAWSKNGVTISGATSATYNKAAADSNDVGLYVCRVSDANGAAINSQGCDVTVTA